ncbi:helix-turn-helix domain-containing protein [Alteromonas macleodii]|jgi:putative transcriptional regulator|uniref:helix-turn-helix domain-containing protein n=1 Tax=Alteromonas macleodii TaxID=28108 RepID=UPI002FE15A4D
MAIVVNLDVVLAQRKVKLKDLSKKLGITIPNLSILKSGKAKAIRFTTLDALCEALDCSPGDILQYQPSESNRDNNEK